MMRISIWKLTYSEFMNTVRGSHFWMKNGHTCLVTQPLELTFLGRKKKKKKRSF